MLIATLFHCAAESLTSLKRDAEMLPELKVLAPTGQSHLLTDAEFIFP